MNQILTDEEIFKLQYEMQCRDGGFHPIPFAKAIEQAILNKLNSAEPVGYRYMGVDGSWRFDVMGKGDIAEAVYEHPPAPSVPKGWTVIHLKTGNEYQVIGEAIDATNMHCNQLMVIYQRDGKTFVREAEEFQEKFKASVSARSD